MNKIDFGGLRDGLAMDDGEAEVLYALVRAIKPNICLEIGTHRGFSTNYIIQALKDNGFGHLWTTDPFEYVSAPCWATSSRRLSASGLPARQGSQAQARPSCSPTLP